MKSRAHVDTSSYLAILLGEKEAVATRKRLARHVLCHNPPESSQLAQIPPASQA